MARTFSTYFIIIPNTFISLLKAEGTAVFPASFQMEILSHLIQLVKESKVVKYSEVSKLLKAW